jgi:hypothetical protein
MDKPPIFTIGLANSVGETQGEFFEYKGSQYFISQPRDGTTASKLYLNCSRGACDSNTGHLNWLVDATQTWTENVYAGCEVKIVDGPGDGEWRKIVSNTATTLVVSPNWDTTHTTASSYVIRGKNVLG